MRLDTALRQGEAGSSFVVANAVVSSMAIWIFGLEADLTAVVFRALEFVTV